MENPSTTQPGGPEKPAAARLSSPAQPANGQPAQQQFQSIDYLPSAEPFKTSKPFAVAKLVLGSFNLVFAIVTLGLSLGAVTTSYTMSSFIGVVIGASLAVASIIWQLAEFITLAVRKGWRSIHPGAHVGVHLILSVLAVLVVPGLCVFLASEMSDYTVDPDCITDSSYPAGYYSYGQTYCGWDTFQTQAAANKYFRMLEALTAFCVFLLIAHLTLFVMACVETDRRRKYGKATKVVYLVSAQGPTDGRTYYTPLATVALGNHNRGSVNHNRGSVLPPQPAHHHQHQNQQGNADPGPHGYYAPPAGVLPGTAA